MTLGVSDLLVAGVACAGVSLLLIVLPHVFGAIQDYNNRQWGRRWMAVTLDPLIARIIGIGMLALAALILWLSRQHTYP